MFSYVPPTPIVANNGYETILSESGIWKMKEWLQQVLAGNVAPKEVAFEVERIVKAVCDFRAAIANEYMEGEGLVSVSEAAMIFGCSANSLYIRNSRGEFPDGVFVPVRPKGKRSKRCGYRINLALLQKSLNDKKGGLRNGNKSKHSASSSLAAADKQNS